jgi:hypothetical protein
VTFALLAALKVTSAPEVGCPDEAAIVARLRAAGIVLRDEDEVRVRFSFANGRRVAEIEAPGAEPRRVEHEGTDCSSLGDATVALLTVLLDERAVKRAGEPAGKPAGPVESPPDDVARVRAEAGMLVGSGIVAPLAIGMTVGAAYRPVHWASIGVSLEGWPKRDHDLREGFVSIAAYTAALSGCAGFRSQASTAELCVFGHAGFYSLSAGGYPVVRPTDRALFALEPAARLALALTRGFGLWLRGGVWIPTTRLDVTVRGADSGFTTTSAGLKAAAGVEIFP